MDALAHTGFRFVTMAVTYVGMAMLAGAIIDNVDWLTNARDSMNSGEDPWGIAVLVRMAIGIIGTIGGAYYRMVDF